MLLRQIISNNLAANYPPISQSFQAVAWISSHIPPVLMLLLSLRFILYKLKAMRGDTAIAVIYSHLQMHKQMQKGAKSQALNQWAVILIPMDVINILFPKD